MSGDGKARCAWADGSDALMVRYHDEEWGTPLHDDVRLFEMLTLEGAQAGLSWRTILHKREGYRAAFAGFDPARVGAFGPGDVERLLADSGIVRNRAKVGSAINNAARVLEVQREYGSLDAYLWSFVGGAPLRSPRPTPADVPATTPESDAMAKALRTRGFRFVGPTVCYAFMQATGMVDDHTSGCFRAVRSRP